MDTYCVLFIELWIQVSKKENQKQISSKVINLVTYRVKNCLISLLQA